MYQLQDQLQTVKGIGKITGGKLNRHDLTTIQDLLLFLPLNYTDLSQTAPINQLQPGQKYTVQAEVISVKEYFKNGKRITRAIIAGEAGRTQCIWFNNRYIKHQLKTDRAYNFAGEFNEFRNFSQPQVETIKSDSVHTGRLVPRYSQTLKIKQGRLRLILKEIVENLAVETDILSQNFNLPSLKTALTQLHFPDDKQLVVQARQRLAIEELLSLIQRAQNIKKQWQQQTALMSISKQKNQELVPKTVPFKLTADQKQALEEIMSDLQQTQPMNRLLIGDVGSGKTIVAALAAQQVIQQGFNVALIAPTQILAEQHWQNLQSILPHLKTKLITANNQATFNANSSTQSSNPACLIKTKPGQTPRLFIGTHAVINKLDQIRPGLIIYDEQHRFGVAQRGSAYSFNQTHDLKNDAQNDDANNSKQPVKTTKQPHVLTMSATPIPRSYMLTIFAHLTASIIKEFPFGEKQLKTWFIPQPKRQDAYQWLYQQLTQAEKTQKTNANTSQSPLALIVCPFIQPSEHKEFADIPAATQIYEKLEKQWGPKLNIELLHGQQKPNKQQQTIDKLFNQQIQVLVATSIVEVGVDLPQANFILIEGADRFGLASLHQLRGRVGRHSQQSYCLIFSSSDNQETKQRLRLFSQEGDGLKLAELDLENRGPGDLFGLEQHGLDNLRFASWNNQELINQAREIFQSLQQNQKQKSAWKPLFDSELEPRAKTVSYN